MRAASARTCAASSGPSSCLDPLFRRRPFDHWVTIAQRAIAAQNGSWVAWAFSRPATHPVSGQSAAGRRDPDVRRAWLTARQLKAFHVMASSANK